MASNKALLTCVFNILKNPSCRDVEDGFDVYWANMLKSK